MLDEQGTTPRMLVGRYQLVRELGHGGMGTVWLAEDELISRQVAIKEIRSPRGLPEEEREILARRALQEARSVARIQHPGAVRLYDALPANDQDDAVYLIMELVRGQTLSQLIRAHGRLPDATVAAYGAALAEVLAAAHTLGIVHRDVKPANVMIAQEDGAAPGTGRVKLADFGIAYQAGGTRLTGSGLIGTQAYMAPELYESQDVTPAADLWSLGVTLYYAVAGFSPFDRDNTGAMLRAIVIDELPVPPCSPPLAAAISAMLVRDPARRMTAAQARAALLVAAGGTPQAPPLPSPLAAHGTPLPPASPVPFAPPGQLAAPAQVAPLAQAASPPAGTGRFSNSAWCVPVILLLAAGALSVLGWAISQSITVDDGTPVYLSVFVSALVEAAYLAVASPFYVLTALRWQTLKVGPDGLAARYGLLHLRTVRVPWEHVTRIAGTTAGSGSRRFLQVWADGLFGDPGVPVRLCRLRGRSFPPRAIYNAIMFWCPAARVEQL